MPEVKAYAPGTFCWVDLATTDALAAGRFYHELFGWTLEDMPTDEAGAYTMAQVRGRDVGALYQLLSARNGDSRWNCYVAVEDAEEAARRTDELGGRVVCPAFDCMEAGRMAVLQGPTGARFAAWESRSHPGAGLVREASCLYWNELVTPRATAAERFYCALFGWRPETTSLDGAGYTLFKREDAPVAGMVTVRTNRRDPSSHWVVYFAVGDCDRRADDVVRLGGKVLSPPLNLSGVGRCAIVADPQGGEFGIVQPERA